MKIILGRQIEEIKKKNSENEKNLLKNRNAEDINELNEDDIYFHSNAIKNIKLGSNIVNRIYLNNSIVYELEDTIDLNLFHSLIPAATTTSVIFDKLENQNISNYNLIGFCDTNNHIAVYQNNTEYLVLNIRNDYIYSPINSGHFFHLYNVLSHCVFHFFNTQNVTDMSYMFFGCSGLTSLDLSNFNTQNVTNMRNMFVSCRRLTSLDVSSFDTSKVKSMNAMFYDCSGLTSLDLSSFNTLNVSDIARMFSFSNLITSIIANSFKLSSLTTSADIFNGCVSLIGGNGTTYNSSYITAVYARVDGENGLPGYFTAPANKK